MVTEMTVHAVVALLESLARFGVTPWIDGGWGVDALVGRQTRPHSDLDLVVEASDNDSVVGMLLEQGFYEVEMWFTTPVHTVWHHNDGRAVDLHLIVLNSDGDGVYGDEGVYPAEGLTGHGVIGGLRVRCITPAVQIDFHRGYELRDQDRHDVALLCDRFGIELPPEYQQ